MARLLIVDDDEATAKLLDMMLTKAGYSVVRANSGDQALEAVHKHQIDLIILDMMMPGMSGIDVCQIVRSDPSIAHLPILFLSAVGEMDRKAEAFGAGADDYVTKPVHRDELLLRTRTLLARRTQAAPAQSNVRHGKVIALLGTGGGIGVSQTAINLAASVLDESPDVIIAELIPGAGKLTTQLKIQDESSLSEFAQLPEKEQTPDAIQKMILYHRSGLDLLPSEQDPRLMLDPDLLRPHTIEIIARHLSENYPLVFLNLGYGLNTRVRAGCAQADHILLVARIEPLSLKVAVQQFQFLQEAGIPKNKLHIILVAFHSIKPEQVTPLMSVLEEGKVHKHVLLTVPPAAELALQAQEQGMPLVLLPQGEKLRGRFKEVMQKLMAA